MKKIISLTLSVLWTFVLFAQQGGYIQEVLYSPDEVNDTVNIYYHSDLGTRIETTRDSSHAIIYQKKTPDIILLDKQLKVFNVFKDLRTTEDDKEYVVKKLGEENINGYKCIHALVTSNGKTCELWNTNDIKDTTYYRLYSGISEFVSSKMHEALKEASCNGFPIKKIVTHDSLIRYVTELTKYDSKLPPSDLFEIPSDYTDTKKIPSPENEEKRKKKEKLQKEYLQGNGGRVQMEWSTTNGIYGTKTYYHSPLGVRQEMQENRIVGSNEQGLITEEEKFIFITQKYKPDSVIIINFQDSVYTKWEIDLNVSQEPYTFEVQKLGVDTVKGYKSIHSRVINKEKITELWTTKEIKDYEMYNYPFNGISGWDSKTYEALKQNGWDGFLVKIIKKETEIGDITTELANFDTILPPANLFEIPEGFIRIYEYWPGMIFNTKKRTEQETMSPQKEEEIQKEIDKQVKQERLEIERDEER